MLHLSLSMGLETVSPGGKKRKKKYHGFVTLLVLLSSRDLSAWLPLIPKYSIPVNYQQLATVFWRYRWINDITENLCGAADNLYVFKARLRTGWF